MSIAITKVKDWYTDESRWNKGAYYIDKMGMTWDQVPGNTELGSCCLIGAVRMCYPNINDRDKIYEKITNYINKDRNKLVTFFDWNDSDYITFRDIKKLVNELDI